MVTETAGWVGKVLSGGRYRVTAKLGEGGMGHVYRAHDKNLDCEVVIKVPRRAMLEDPEFAARFTREIRSLVRLVHPHIVKAMDVGEQDGQPFAVLQYLSGGSLRDRQSQGPEGRRLPLPPGELRSWLEGVATALDFIHGQHYIHRDVKPENILFDAHGNPYLGDFGVAKVLADTTDQKPKTVHTGTGMVLGTPQYMAPELIMGQPYDGRIDQYALAVTVYELLAGRYPFDATTSTAIFVMQTTQEPAPLAAVAPALPKVLATAVHRALAKDPAGRFPNCTAFVRALLAGLAETSTAGSASSPAAGAGQGVKVKCPGCQKVILLPPATLGKRCRCPSCGTVFQAPAASKPNLLPETGRAEATKSASVARPVLPLSAKSAVPSNPPTPPAPQAPVSPLAELNFSNEGRTSPRKSKKVQSKKLQASASGPRHYWPWLAGAGAVLSLGLILLFGFILRGGTKADKVALEIEEVDKQPKTPPSNPQTLDTHRETTPSEASKPSPSPTIELPAIRGDQVGEIFRYTKYPSCVWCVAVTTDGTRALCAGGDDVGKAVDGADYSIHLWDLKTGQQLRRFEGHRKTVRALAVSPDGQHFVSGSADKTIRLWDLETGKEAHRFEGHQGPVTSLAIHPDGHQLVSAAADDNIIRIWSLDDAMAELPGYNGPPDGVDCLAISADGRQVLAAGADKTVRLWDLEARKELASFRGFANMVSGLAFSPNGQQFLAGVNYNDDDAMRVWDIEKRQNLRGFGRRPGGVKSLALSADGKRVLSGNADGTVRLWEMETGQQTQRFEGHSGPTSVAVAFSPDGRFALSGSLDRTVRLWKLPEIEIVAPPMETSPSVLKPIPIAKPHPPLSPVLKALKPGSLKGRIGVARTELVREGGGNQASEDAVGRGLKWLVQQQNPNGSWGTDIGHTALGLLPLLGVGETHKLGNYVKPISNGLTFLCKKQNKKDGSIGQGYHHALATLVLCEAYGLTGDPRLQKPAQAALNYMVRVQHGGGGWRYHPRQPGDTSVTGWFYLALRTGYTVGLDVPKSSFDLAHQFFNSVQGPEGGYGYLGPNRPERAMACTAAGSLCRLYQGWDLTQAHLAQGIEYMQTSSPPLPTTNNIYYLYYATQVMRHLGGDPWESWNPKVRDLLISTQETGSDPMTKGSWPERADVWGKKAGRLMVTAFSLLTLESYYRHVPLHFKYQLADSKK